jgi:hypothetical protein
MAQQSLFFFFSHFVQVKNICSRYFLLQMNAVLPGFFSPLSRMLYLLQAVCALPLGYGSILANIPLNLKKE